MTIKIIDTVISPAPGKVADAELHFDGPEDYGPLAGLKLIGFAVWERHGEPTGHGSPVLPRTVTFPCRQYSVNGERRNFALLRPLVGVAAKDRLVGLILSAYESHQRGIS